MFLLSTCISRTDARENFVNRNGVYDVQNYQPDNYNAGKQNWCTVQDSAGIIYVGNSSGVLEFDGREWRIHVLPGRQAVFSLTIDSRGILWAGSKDDLGYFKPDASGRLQYNSLSSTLPDSVLPIGRVRTILQYKNGLYFRTHKYLLGRKNHKWMVWKSSTSFYKPFVVHNRFYIWEAKKGLLTLNGKNLVLEPSGKFFKRYAPSAMLAFNSKTSLIATWNKGVFLYDSVSVRAFPLDFPGSSLQITDARIIDKNIAILTYKNGLYIFNRRGRLLQKLNTRSGLADIHGNHLFVDSHSDIWLANNSGISRIMTGLPFTVYKNAPGITGKIRHIVKYRDNLYLATSDGIWWKTNRGKMLFKPVAGGNVSAWFFLKTERALLCATLNGVMVIKNNKARLISTDQPKTFVLMKSKTEQNTVYAGTEDGLGRILFRNGRWRYAGKIAGIKNEIRSMVQIPGNVFWLGTNNHGFIQAHVKKGRAAIIFKTNDDQPGSWNGNKVVALSDGLYFYNAGGQLKRFNPQKYQFYNDSTQLGRAGPVYRLISDEKNRLWFLGYKNGRYFYHLARWSNNRYIWDTKPFYKPLSYQAQNIYMENDSISWFGAGSVLIRYNHHWEQEKNAVFSTLIRRILFKDSLVYDGHPGALNINDFRFAYRNNAFRFEYTLPGFNAKKNLRFRYRLEGYEKDWSAWRSEFQKNYTNLYEGAYRFHVQARDNFGHVFKEAAFNFSILPPWYRTPFAYFIYVVFLILVIWVIDRIRSMQVVRKTEIQTALRLKHLEQINSARQEARRQVRKKTSADFHDELGHVLTKLSLLTELAKRSAKDGSDTHNYLEKIGRGISELGAGVKDFIWLLDSDKDTLYDTLIRIKDFGDSIFEYSAISFNAGAIPSSFEHKKISLDIRRNITLIFKEAMNNCLKYSAAGQAAFFARDAGKEIEIIFTDNGHGFDPENQTMGYGLKNMRQRAQKINARLIILSEPGKTEIILSILKIPDENAPDG